MTESNLQSPSEWEQRIAELLRNPDASREQVLEARRGMPGGERFVMKNEWMDMGRNETFENWRRLASYQFVIERVISYPCALDSFITDALLPLGIQEDQLVDMSMASYVPVFRNGYTVYLAVLPFSSSLGSTGLYIAVDPTNKIVQEAAVYPGINEAQA